MDDTLAGLNQQVADGIMERAILGYCQDKTRILVTH